MDVISMLKQLDANCRELDARLKRLEQAHNGAVKVISQLGGDLSKVAAATKRTLEAVANAQQGGYPVRMPPEAQARVDAVAQVASPPIIQVQSPSAASSKAEAAFYQGDDGGEDAEYEEMGA